VGELLANTVLLLGQGSLGAVEALLGERGGLGTGASLGVTELGSSALEVRVGADGGVGLGVHLLEVISGNTGGNELRELSLVRSIVLLGELTHVVGDVLTEDVVTVNIGVGLDILTVLDGSGVASVRVRDVNTTVAHTLHGTEETGTSGGTGKTDIQQGAEGRHIVLILDVEVLTQVDLILITRVGDVTLVLQTKLGVDTTGQQQTGAVSGRVVGQTNLDSVTGELVRVGGSDANIVGQIGHEHLADDILVGGADYESVLGGLVLVLVLDDQTLTGVVIGLTFAATLELDLETLVVSLVLDNFDERHG